MYSEPKYIHIAEHPAHNKRPTNTHGKWHSMVLMSQTRVSVNASSGTYTVCDLRKIVSALRFNFPIF